jgi:hypothetical protein
VLSSDLRVRSTQTIIYANWAKPSRPECSVLVALHLLTAGEISPPQEAICHRRRYRSLRDGIGHESASLGPLGGKATS